MVDVDGIVPHPKNNNRHSVDQIKRLEKLIKHNGFRVPLIVSNHSGFLIAGHGRLDAAKNIGLEQVPVIYQDFENEAEEYQFLTADNAIQAWSEIDMQSVYDFVDEVGDFDVDTFGFNHKLFSRDPSSNVDPLTEWDESMPSIGDNTSNTEKAFGKIIVWFQTEDYYNEFQSVTGKNFKLGENTTNSIWYPINP